ncbi:DNA repair protein RAD51 homolog 3-like [Lutzomyia longipalpis]|uniref:DNA repair protein RAD51 homolog 3-like n=1 Tax=Lutzomyia longipalpis TaxID=7200 RepID=UPI002483CF60|nr:DNA repair protein RAD51 homolog 3-like [Lutzomyia longipalpis]
MEASGSTVNDIVWEFFGESVWDSLCKDNGAKLKSYRGIFFYIRELDFATEFGVLPGYLTEICGVAFSGRTQLCVKLCINVCIPAALHGLDGESLYIDSRQKFHPRMIEHLVASTNTVMKKQFVRINFKLTAEEVRRRMHYMDIISEKEFLTMLGTLKDYLKQHPRIRLVVIDSLIAFFHNYAGRSIQRVKHLLEILFRLDAIAAECDVAMVIVNDMTTKIAPDGRSSKVIPALGTYFANKIPFILQLSPTLNGKYMALLQKNYKNSGKSICYDFCRPNEN